MRAIALTGRIGAGKSTIARILRERGAATIDADMIVRDLYRDDGELRAILRDRFGDGVLVQGDVNRAALGAIVFRDDAARRDLEVIVHPRVHAREAEFLGTARARGAAVAAIEAIKVVESGGADQCDELWIVECDDATAITRLAARGMASDEAARRLASQGRVATWVARFTSDSARLGRPRAVVVIDNSGTTAQAAAQVAALTAELDPPA